MKHRSGCALLLGATLGATLFAQPTIDGTKDAIYGAPRAVQNTPTSFGDSNLGQIGFANGSELDAAYGVVIGNTLYLILTGNVESNFNKLEIFFETRSGGQNRLRGDNPDVDFNGLNRMGDDGTGNGLTFDLSFEADFWMGATGGNPGTGEYTLFANYAELRTDTSPGVGRYLGFTSAGSDGTLSGGNNPDGIRVTINNSNTAGVTDSTTTGAELVMTGAELAIPLSAIGNPRPPFTVCAMINGLFHDFMSNQVLAGIGGGGHLGEPRNINFANIPGDQFFIVSILGDVDGDGCVDNTDLNQVLSDFGTNATHSEVYADGAVNDIDLAFGLSQFGNGCE